MRRTYILVPALILLLSIVSFAEEGDQYPTRLERSEIRYPGFFNVLHTCAVGKNKAVIFSRGAQLVDGDEQFRGIFAHNAKPGKKKGSRPQVHFQGIGGSWGANALDSAWPGSLQQSKKKFGLLFAAITPDYDGTPAKFVVSPFDNRGRLVGKQTVFHEVAESADNKEWLNTAWIAVEMGPHSVGVAFSYVIDDYNSDISGFDFQSRAYFIEFDFQGKPVSALREITLAPQDGKDAIARVFRPAWIDGRWIVPISSRSIQDGAVLQDQLNTARIGKRNIRVRTIDSADVTSIDSRDDFVFSDAQFLALSPQAGAANSDRQLLVQRRDFAPGRKPDVRRYDTHYFVYDVDARGKSAGDPKQLKLKQWIPQMEAEDRDIWAYDEAISTAQPDGNGGYVFVVTREAGMVTRDKYQFVEAEFNFAILGFSPGRNKIRTLVDTVEYAGYFSRVSREARRDLVRLNSTGSLMMPHECLEEGYYEDRRCWLDMLILDMADAVAP